MEMKIVNLLNKVKNKNNGTDFPKNRIVKNCFVESLYQYEDGVIVEIKYLSRLMSDKYGNTDNKTMFVNMEIGEMTECIAQIVDENNEYVKVIGKFGVEEYATEIVNATGMMVSIPLLLAPDKNGSGEFYVSSFKSYYQIIRSALVNAGKMPTDYDGAFTVSYEDLKQALVGYRFRLGVRKSTAKGIKPYDVFVVIDDEDGVL